ncbi:MAG: biopolymer transporter ExbD, partial [Gammaproteobacteria bacterium]|nr:biopolymer transporter ExbD [Gammaproteobacteria bacterium]
MEIQRQLSDDDKARVDMTPMLDVVFILLIFFIVTASFIRATSLELRTA